MNLLTGVEAVDFQQLNRDSKIPLYHQLYEILRARILRGDWQPGDMIPTGPELTEHYQVSRMTVRQSMDILVSEGLIYRRRGLGTFVSQPTIETGLSHMIDFAEDMRSRGFRPSTKILAAYLAPVSQNTAKKLEIELGEELAVIRRLRLANEEPISIEASHLVHRYCPDVLEKHDYASYSLRKALEQDYGIRWKYAKQIVRAISASEEIAGELGIAEFEPVLAVERISYAQNDKAVEFLRIYYRGDRYSLFGEIQS